MPSPAIGLADFEALARDALEPAAFAYFAGGAADEITLRANAQAWAALRLRPRVLQPMTQAHTRVTLLGHEWPLPWAVAPMAAQALAHAHAESGLAAAAAAQGAGMVLSSQTSTPLAEVARHFLPEATRGPLWFQLYWQGSLQATLTLAQQAVQAGHEALVLTVDAPVNGARDRERRAGFTLPAAALAGHHQPPSPSGSGLCAGLLVQAPLWADVETLARQVGVPLLLKGLLHPQDALQAVQTGAAGVIVSNHGGRTLDTAVPTAEALPNIVRAVAGAVPVLVDGGIRRGTDVLKALALGASAVLVGRPLSFALASGGAPAVAQALRLLRDEFEIALALCGCPQPAAAGPGLLAGAAPGA